LRRGNVRLKTKGGKKKEIRSDEERAIEDERNGKGVCKIYYLIAGGESY
jgi:hypothetical protein